MEKEQLVSSTSNNLSSTENNCSIPSSSNFALPSNTRHVGHPVYRTYHRSKSLSSFFPETYSRAEVKRIRERLSRSKTNVVPSAIKTFSRRQKMTLLSLALVDFMSFCSMSIMAPFFPKEARQKGLTNTLSGFIFSFYALVMFTTSPIFGKLLPKLGAKFLFLFGIFVAGICNILFGMLEYINDYTLFTTLCILVRGLEALGGSAFSTASYVYVINLFPNNIGSVIGILETFVGLGMSTGPALGGLLYSLGGFSLPFIALGVAMILVAPVNIFLLPPVDDCDNMTHKSPSMFKLMKVPAVLVTCLVVVIVSSTWAFLDPTLEPHLGQFDLNSEQIGLIFLMFSALYGISSPLWGWLADKVHNHWSMMVAGLGLNTVALLLLGPCPPLLPYIGSYLWLNMLSLSILGVSVALALMPTFQGLLTSATDSGCRDSLATYSMVAGIWSCMYSFGEIVGPALGGFLLQYYGFPLTSTVMASATFVSGVVTCIFFVCKNVYCVDADNGSDSGISESWGSTSTFEEEHTPLLLSTIDSGYRMYTEDKVNYYETTRKQETEMGETDPDQVTDVRGTVSITHKGACEV